MLKKFLIYILRKVFGERCLQWIHSLRFVYLVKYNRNREAEMDLIPLIMAKDNVTVDVGANGANWTYHLSKIVEGKGKVFSFEADPYYANVTEKTIKMLGLKNVEFFSYGLADADKSEQLKIYDHDGNRYRGLSYIARGGKNESEKNVLISLRKLDDLVPKYPRLSETKMIKCDVEGYELSVLKGARKLIASTCCALILEIGHSYRYGVTANDIFSFLDSMGYSGYLYKSAKSKTVDFNESLFSSRQGRNVLFLPREDSERHLVLRSKLQKISFSKL